MTALLRYARDWGLAVLTASAVTFLIAADIARAAGWTWDPIRTFFSALLTSSDQPRLVRNYSEFIKVSHGHLDVTTGIRFVSSIDGKIASQWCYVERRSRRWDEAETTLTLATAENAMPPAPRPASHRQLQEFGLTADAAARLIETHCQFRSR